MTCNSGLVDLPPELIELIISHGLRSAIFSLRLTCRELAAKSDYAFLDQCFVLRNFYLTSPLSISSLKRISEIPRLAKKLLCIRFSVEELEPSYDHWVMRRISQERTQCQRSDRARLRESRKHHQVIELQHKKYAKEGQDFRDLVEVFQNLMGHGCDPAIFTNLAMGDEPVWKFHRLRQVGELVGGDGMRPSFNRRPLEILWRAIAESGYPIRHLEMGWESQSLPMNVLEPAIGRGIQLQNLQRLNLTLWTGASEENEDEWRRYLAALNVVILLAQDLRTLRLAFDDQGACEAFHYELLVGLATIAEHGHDGQRALTNLTHLRLDGIQIHPLQFVRLVDVLAKDLFDMRLISLTNIPEWEEKTMNALCKYLRSAIFADLAPDEITVVVSEEWTRLGVRRLGYDPEQTTW